MNVRSRLAVFGIVACALMLLLAACNTVEGVGKDLKAGGEALQDSANSHR